MGVTKDKTDIYGDNIVSLKDTKQLCPNGKTQSEKYVNYS